MQVQQAISEIMSQKGEKISYEALGKALGFSKQYVGQIKSKELTESQMQKIEEFFNVDFTKVNNSDDCISIDYYPEVFGSCGSGRFVLSEEKELIQVPKKFFKTFSPVKHYSVINALGDSMKPYIQDKDRLIVEHWEGGQIKDNRVYVFCYKDEIFVKRLIKNVDEIIIKSDNPDPMYRPRYIEKENMNDVLIVGEIVGLMRDMR